MTTRVSTVRRVRVLGYHVRRRLRGGSSNREGATEISALWTFSLLDPRPDGRYLDFGCGADPVPVRLLHSLGFDVTGFDPTAVAGDPRVLSDWSALAGRRFDGIITHHVLEHLVDPVATTRRLAGLLAPGGRLVHATECFDEVITDTRFHLWFFTGRSPEVLADRAGLRIAAVERRTTTAYVFEPLAPIGTADGTRPTGRTV